MMQVWDLVVVGAGIAGLSAIKAYRSVHPKSSVLLIDREDHLPYKRTKLSKILKDGSSIDEFILEPESFYDDIQFLLETSVESINTKTKTLVLDSDETFTYKSLILTTGSHPSIPDSAKLHRNEVVVLRNANDLDLIRKKLPHTKKVLVVGMGVLGIELAEQIKLMGKEVVAVGSGALILKRELTERASEIIEQTFTKKSIELRFMDEIIALDRRNGSIHVSFLHSKEASFDLVLWATGTGPNTELAKSAGIKVGRGILVDEHMLTSAPDVWAAGDCVEDKNGHITHLWHESEDQGRLAGLAAAGRPEDWVNQGYRLKCEAFGIYMWSLNKPESGEGYEFIEIERDKIYYAVYLKSGAISGIVMVGDKGRNHIYEKAVHESWTLAQLSQELS